MSETTEKKKIAIIDGKSVFYRGYYAMPSLSTKDGTPTGGVYGFAVMALEVVKRLEPDYVCVAWDKPKTNIRKRVALFPEYKAGRKPPPPDFYEQIPILHELLDAFGWPLFELDDYEADDIMGAFAVQAKEQGLEALLITSDLDVLQLVNDSVHVYALKKGFSNIELYKPESFTKKYGITPEQFLDLKALMGDSSDNIPGVAGVGEKTAVTLLQEYKTLDGVYENLDFIKDSTRKKLEAGKENAYLSKKLASIWVDAPVELDVSNMGDAHIDVEKLISVLQKLEFRTLLRQLPESMRNGNGAVPAVSDSVSATHTIEPEAVQMVTTKEAIDTISLGDTCVLHTIAAGAHGARPQYIILSNEDRAMTYCIDVDKLDPTVIASVLGDIRHVIGYDVKSSLQVLLELDIELPHVKHDVFVGAFILDSLRRDQTLTELAKADVGYVNATLDDIPPEDISQKAGEIVAVVKQLYQLQVSELAKTEKLTNVAHTIEWPVIPVLARMEHEGMKLDVSYLHAMSEELEDDITDVEQEIYGHADTAFNVSSPQQLSEVLFEHMKLPTDGIKKGKTGYSTAAQELGKLRDKHPIIELILQYREYTKLKNTYVDTLPKLIDKDSRVHTTFHLTIAQTGRLSSTDPNLQNIPVRTELGKRIRRAFVADEGKRLVSADYSQFELRLAAYLADDKALIELFNDGHDVHTMTAAQIYGREPEDVTKTMRRDAKVINFGVLYGMSPHGLVAATGMSYDAAKKFIQSYFSIRKPIRDYIETIKDRARKDGYVETLYGRRRPTPDIHSSNFIVRQAAERAAVNMPIQGTEADIMKLAMADLDQKLPQGAIQLLQIHDSILVECNEEDADSVAELMKQVMESASDIPIALQVDTSIGSHWGEL